MKNMDELLKQNLLPDCVPEEHLNASVLKKAKETQTMKKKTFRSGAAAAAAVAILTIGSVSGYAAYRYLTPSQVADQMTEDGRLAKAFESKDAITVNETQKTAGYDITLMGIVSGKDLSPVAPETSQEEIDQEKTYAVVAIAREDGKAMPDILDADYQTFCVSALIHGKNFLDVNNATLNAGVSSFVQDGVQYEILECDNLEMFANMGVYMGVVESFGNESQAFTLDEKTGDYTINEDFDGMKALFTIPLDPSKADDAAAAKYFAQLEQQEDSQATEDQDNSASDAEPVSEESRLVSEWEQKLIKFGTFTSEEAQAYIKQHAEIISQETYTANADGGLSVKSDAGVAEFNAQALPEETGVETVFGYSSDGTFAGTACDTITKNEDGTYTYTVYRPANMQ